MQEGLGNNKQGNVTFVNVVDGKFSIKSSEGVEGSVMRVNKNGATVYELHYQNLVGRLVDVFKAESPYGLQWNFNVSTSSGKIFNLKLNYDSGIAVSLLKMLSNIKIEEPLEISLSTKEENGKKKVSVFVKQNNENVKFAFTKENPNGLPAWEKIVVKGVETWDNTNEIVFLEGKLQEIKHKFSAVNNGVQDGNLNAKIKNDSQLSDAPVYDGNTDGDEQPF